MNVIRIYIVGLLTITSLVMQAITPDPHSEGYYSISPYAYCAGNPIRYIDPNGKELVFSQDATPEFKQMFDVAKTKLINSGVGQIISELGESKDYVVTISYGNHSFYNSENNTIYWNPQKGIYTDLDVSLSPTTILNHEASHALRYNTDKIGMESDAMSLDDKWRNKEEKRVVEEVERPTAEALGEIEQGQKTRLSIFGIEFIVSNPTSNINQYEITIIGNGTTNE